MRRGRSPKGRLALFCALALWSLGVGAMPALSAGANTYGYPQTSSASVSQPLGSDVSKALSRAETEKARETLQAILRRPDVDADTLLRVGLDFAAKDLYPEAAQAFARCAKEYPAVFEGHYNLALAEFAQQKFPEALAALQAARHGSELQELARSYLRGKIENALGRTAEAERDLSAAFAGAPRQENYALDLGLFYLRERAYAHAVETFERGAAFNPYSPFLALGLALAEFLGGREPQSLETSKKLLELEPDFAPARLLMAFASYMTGNLEQAEQFAAQGLKNPQASGYLYYLHATILLKRQSRDYGQMLEELAVATRSIPRCSLCYLTQSKVHQAWGETSQAITDLETAVRLDPGFAEAWYRLAPLYQSAGRSDDAARARKQFQQLKTEKENRETEMLRSVFLETLGGEQQSASRP